jgi:uncharacterized protein YkwD
MVVQSRAFSHTPSASIPLPVRPPTSRLKTILCLSAMAVGLATAASAHPGVRSRVRGVAERAAARIDYDAVDEPLLAAAIFAETNARRADASAPPLRFHPTLGAMARRHADRMVEHDFYSHGDPLDPGLARPDLRARRVGIENPHIGENIHDHRAIEAEGPVYPLGKGRFSATPDGPPLPAYTYRALARQIVDEWMASRGHRANILRRDARQVGVGVRFYWRDGGWPFVKAVQDFQVFEDVELE